MIVQGNAKQYGRLAITLHWLIAACILTLLGLGFGAAVNSGTGREAAFLRVHVPLGIVVLVLTLLRALWWSLDERPAPVEGQPGRQLRLARVTHVLLYAVPVLASASGIGLIILSGAAPILFGGEAKPLPRFMDFPPMVVHIIAAFVLIGLVTLHVAAAAYHQFWRHDRLLARMGIGRPEARLYERLSDQPGG